jgi:hypothetical protein
MKTKSKEIEALLVSGSDNYNDYFFDMYVGVLECGMFEDALVPLNLYDKGIKGLLKANETPVQAIEKLEESLDSKKLDKPQKFFIWEWVHHYIKNGEIEDDIYSIKKLLEAHLEKFSPDPIEVVKVKTMQKHLKAIIQKEVENIEQYLGQLKPKDRLDYVLKILPYVMPKTKNVHPERYEKD